MCWGGFFCYGSCYHYVAIKCSGYQRVAIAMQLTVILTVVIVAFKKLRSPQGAMHGDVL